MSETIRQADLRNDNAAIMRRVAKGESFVVTVNGRPVADLVPHQRDSAQRRFVPAETMARAMAELPAVDARAWARDVAEADGLFGSDAIEDPWRRSGRGTTE
jgi:prevent-host-death family protein